jgi:Ca-activated chloride channel family protein
LKRRDVLLTPLVLVAGTRRARAQTFSAGVDGVRLDVLVTDGGRPVPGLGAADFEVRDNGVPQPIDLVNIGDVPVSVVLALDLSRSVDGPKLAALRRAGTSLIDALVPGDAAGLVSFNTAVVAETPLATDLAATRRALVAAKSRGDTALIDAALAAMLIGDTDAGRTLVVLFSDGVDTCSFTSADTVIETAKRVNGVIYAVRSRGPGPTGLSRLTTRSRRLRADDNDFLPDLTAATGGRVVDVDESGDPGPAFVQVLQEFRRRYVITYTPTGVDAPGWHRLDVRVARRGARVQARAGYFAGRR